jgi:hypothetical protein
MRFRSAAPATVLVAVLTVALSFPAPRSFAGQVWTDANGDGLPDNRSYFSVPSDLLSVDIWLDTQSFTFTSFRVTVERSGPVSTAAASYWISGGSNSPIDSTSRPNSLIYSGSGYSAHGVTRIGLLVVHPDQFFPGCAPFVSPIIDAQDAFACRLTSGGGSQQFYFQTASSSYMDSGECFDLGACCLPNGSCFETYMYCDCVAAGGQFLGCKTACADCVPTGVEPQTSSWGRVKTIFR